MIVKEFRCDVCEDVLVNDKMWVVKSFNNIRLGLRKYHICDDCKEEIVKVVKEKKEKRSIKSVVNRL